MFPSSEKTRAVPDRGSSGIFSVRKRAGCCAWRTGRLKPQWRSANSKLYRLRANTWRNAVERLRHCICTASCAAALGTSFPPARSIGPSPRRPALPPSTTRASTRSRRDEVMLLKVEISVLSRIAAYWSRGNRDREAWPGGHARQPPRTSAAPGSRGMGLERRDISGSDLPEGGSGSRCLALWC